MLNKKTHPAWCSLSLCQQTLKLSSYDSVTSNFSIFNSLNSLLLCESVCRCSRYAAWQVQQDRKWKLTTHRDLSYCHVLCPVWPFFFFSLWLTITSVLLIPHSQMNGAAFPSPTAEMAEMNRIQYELEYTEGISQRMRIPEMLKVAPHNREDPNMGSQEVPHSVIMQVPERIVISGQYAVKHLSFLHCSKSFIVYKRVISACQLTVI